jgi:DNA-binding beta-propeller fold protein YncE
MNSKNHVAPVWSPVLVLGLWVTCPNSVWPQSITATVPVTGAIAINRATNRIYVAGGRPTMITVVDGVSHATLAAKLVVGLPRAVAVNEGTNKVYIAMGGLRHCPGFGAPCVWLAPGSVIVIDGATNATTTVADPNAIDPCSLAVNPSTNRIYVANCGSGNVSLLDGVSNATTTIVDRNATSLAPVAIAVNPTTNRIYVANKDMLGNKPGNVTVIDGATNSTVTVTDPSAVGPNAVAVNTVTNRIYVTNGGSCQAPATNHGNVTVIDGDTNSTTTVTDPNACYPRGVAINQTTNTIYVANANVASLSGKAAVTIINGATNATATVVDPNGMNSLAAAVDEVTNTVYVANQAGCDDPDLCVAGTNPGSISVINGTTNAVKTLIDPLARGPGAVAVDPDTDQIYVANAASANLTVIEGSGTPIAHTLAILLAGNGGGAVSSSPVGIDCGTTCAMSYAIGTAVKLTASANAGSNFSGWSGPCAGSSSCDVVANEDQFVTATFTSPAPVPGVVGMTQADATTAITGAGLVVGTVTQQSSSTVTAGNVITESPAAGASVAPGSAVNLVVSSGDPSAGGSSGGGSSGGGGGIDLLTLGSLLGCLLLALRKTRSLP